MHTLIRVLNERISAGLKRKAITSCSKWAEAYRYMGMPFPGIWSFKHHPWLRQLHDDDCETVVVQKAAQMGFTEWALNKAFYTIDVLAESVLYILPASTPDASDFSSSRFDPALELSPHLRGLFSDVKNVGHKRAGNASLFVRGSRSQSQLRSIPVSKIIFDEVDVMMQENIALARERTSGQLYIQHMFLSTPTIDDFGINTFYKDTSQDHFMFRCPGCNRLTELIYPECLHISTEDYNSPLIKNSHLKCKECQVRLDHESKSIWLAKGEWISSFTDRMSKGYHINQLYSMVIEPWKIAVLALQSRENPENEQSFYNSKLGMCHVVAGARVTDSMLHECTGEHKSLDSVTSPQLITMGIDVGGWLHYEICSWHRTQDATDIHTSVKARVIKTGKCLHFEELDTIIKQFRVLYFIIDANPERRKALELCQRFYGRSKMCYYGNAVSGKTIHEHAESECSITVDRTSWLDVSLGRFKLSRISIPIDTSMEYKNHIKSLVRIYEKDQNGNPVGKYVKGNDDDHFAHARNYNEMALAMVTKMGANQSINSPI